MANLPDHYALVAPKPDETSLPNSTDAYVFNIQHEHGFLREILLDIT